MHRQVITIISYTFPYHRYRQRGRVMRFAYIKTGKKTRKVWIPNRKEKSELLKIKQKLDWLYHKLGIPDSVHGFVYGRNCRTNAEQHCDFDYTISMDLKDFFDSVKEIHLAYLAKKEVEKTLVKGAARQGLPTSPVLSNIAMLPFDRWAEQLPVRYTRYADDITISGNDLEELQNCQRQIQEKLHALGFRINHKKTKLQTSKNRRIITGLSVDKDVRASRKSRRKLRAAIHQKNNDSKRGLQEWCSCKRPMKVTWVTGGSWDSPIVQSMYETFMSGSRRYKTKTFKGSRSSLKRYLMRRLECLRM